MSMAAPVVPSDIIALPTAKLSAEREGSRVWRCPNCGPRDRRGDRGPGRARIGRAAANVLGQGEPGADVFQMRHAFGAQVGVVMVDVMNGRCASCKWWGREVAIDPGYVDFSENQEDIYRDEDDPPTPPDAIHHLCFYDRFKARQGAFGDKSLCRRLMTAVMRRVDFGQGQISVAVSWEPKDEGE